MDANPVLKPKLATPALILGSAGTLVCVIYLVGAVTAYGQSPMFLVLATLATVLLAAALGAIWFGRACRLRAWTAAAVEKWNHFDNLKRSQGTTTEVTVLSVDAVEPTGSWITIYWNRFDHIQRAWLEALSEPIWTGAVLLIAPDPAQVAPGAPWPPTYFIRASNFLAWAPSRQGLPKSVGRGTYA